MANTVNSLTQEQQISTLIRQYLANRQRHIGSQTSDGPHIDQDTLSAFVEGVLDKREAGPVVSHLVDCSFCRHISAELFRLELEFAPTNFAITEATESPAKLSEVLNRLFSKIFSSSDSAVFAHNDDESRDAGEKDDNEGSDKEGS